MNFEQIQLNKVFCRMHGLVVIEGMNLSGHLSNIDEIFEFFVKFSLENIQSNSRGKKGTRRNL